MWGRGGYKRESGTETPPTATPTVVRQQMDTVEPMPPEQPEMEEDSSSTTTAVSDQSCSVYSTITEQIITIESCPDTMSDQHQCWPDMI